MLLGEQLEAESSWGGVKGRDGGEQIRAFMGEGNWLPRAVEALGQILPLLFGV